MNEPEALQELAVLADDVYRVEIGGGRDAPVRVLAWNVDPTPKDYPQVRGGPHAWAVIAHLDDAGGVYRPGQVRLTHLSNLTLELDPEQADAQRKLAAVEYVCSQLDPQVLSVRDRFDDLANVLASIIEVLGGDFGALPAGWERTPR